MSIIIESGVGTGNRAGLTDKNLQTYAVQQSATNHISTSILGGRTGVFTVRNSASVSLGTANKSRALAITNTDPINFMVVDSAYIQIVSSDLTLPYSGIIVGIDNISGVSIISGIINDNKASNITPTVINRAVAAIGGSISSINIPRMFPTVGDICELIIPGSDSFLIHGLPTNVSDTAGNNIFSISTFNNSGSTINIVFNAFIRFMMVHPSELG